ncbi:MULTISPECIES: glutathione-disulfide reductase [Cupriavidus]|uniref:glutathione-disulfide reductase n=1 Tax=Cupriavidus sp. DF5525 TaxID=3160989 RepID=UPI0003B0F429|nr:hypothetical protein N234_23860 [Ralstonia pickettii DTP0602]
MSYELDLFVIGAGSGGVRAARIGARAGARVAIAEADRVGGTCVMRGCVPKKLLVLASRFSDSFADAPGFGWRVDNRHFDWSRLLAAKDRELARLEQAYSNGLDADGVTLYRERAVIEDAHTVRLASGRSLRSRYILVATGGSPVMPTHIAGACHGITSDEAFGLEALPDRILIVGGGYVAVEFAGIFRGMGVATTLVHRGSHLLRGFDADLQSRLETAYVQRGVDLRLRTTVTSIEQGEGGGLDANLSDGTGMRVDTVLFAVGRRPLTSEIGLKENGVAMDSSGSIQVDADSRTSVPSIFAVGDVTNRANLTPAAILEGQAVAELLFGDGKTRRMNYGRIPTAVFSTPEIATVGLSEAAARAGGGPVRVFRTDFRPLSATLSGSAERVLMKIVVDAVTDKVVGVHIAGAGAAEMVQLVAVALEAGATKAQFDSTIALHPTAAEELVTLREPLPDPVSDHSPQGIASPLTGALAVS